LENTDQSRILFYELLPDIYKRGDFLGKTDFIEYFLRGFEDILQGEEREELGYCEKGLTQIMNRTNFVVGLYPRSDLTKFAFTSKSMSRKMVCRFTSNMSEIYF